MEIPVQISYNGELSRIVRMSLERHGHILRPELVPGSSRGTILEDDNDVKIVKNNPTRYNWYIFLTKKGFRDDGCRLINNDHNEWPIRYALARTFSGMNVEYEMPITADMFGEDSFLCFPEAMKHIIAHDTLDCTVNWSITDYLDLWATLEYRSHYPDRNADGMRIFYWYGQLDRNGILRGKLELRKDDKETY